MKKFLKSLLALIWVPFNRDDLWNLALNCYYCTYNPFKLREGLIFCHVPGMTVEKRMRDGTGLRVTRIYGKGRYGIRGELSMDSGVIGS